MELHSELGNKFHYNRILVNMIAMISIVQLNSGVSEYFFYIEIRYVYVGIEF